MLLFELGGSIIPMAGTKDKSRNVFQDEILLSRKKNLFWCRTLGVSWPKLKFASNCWKVRFSITALLPHQLIAQFDGSRIWQKWCARTSTLTVWTAPRSFSRGKGLAGEIFLKWHQFNFNWWRKWASTVQTFWRLVETRTAQNAHSNFKQMQVHMIHAPWMYSDFIY